MYLRLENISKRFNSFIANDNISLSVDAGKIHGILGENGAGKTTLMNIIGGLYQPDAGEIYLQDQPVKITSPNQAIKLGIGMIYQHFMLVPQLTVTENIILGRENSWRLNLRQKQQEIAALSQAYGLEIDPTAKVEDLPVGTQQRVEILKVLYRQAKLLILDEPTAVLTPTEVESLINILRQLAAAGNTIIFISHKLEEVINLCDTVTVLRRGKVVATTTTKDMTPQKLAELMVGREVVLQVNKSAFVPGKVILSVENLQVADDRGILAVHNVSFQLLAGEILGIAGVDGNGQRELADAIANLRGILNGTIQLNSSSPQQKIGYIPEDRQKMGLVLQFTIAQNLILNVFKKIPFCRHFLLKSSVIKHHAQVAMQEFDIRATGEDIQVSQLSGGNQQKVVLARELAGKPDLIVAMQPTRGLDVGATSAVHSRLLTERDRGAAILYISTELEEVMAMSDRIAVIYRGKFVAILDAQTAIIEEIGLLMAGGTRRE
ncbi:nucleoside ABC transporter ATP-binding protein [Trichormus variabilis ATCC 29413]|uniref:Nucleoside ABC transporter ATP-binding protein n=2 Tax=Anabaena variabilis TaxID=264691 RepID=Q3M9X2_TRIV2|nr:MULTISPECIES: ABC transporter ATP-binding protein [Nostocaceae]ABA22214.1 nucleoside ABC transporter ATP-binding protein [Trichormus variabilis ATCC 29413]MBC1217660.1 ABC transporter ATP-binding protein [Trichormus variabilis ARAD]MBC1254335.1 ABC transporter ATP-binding protein [Trichormus variabilis V5]MBC1268043.1 ABC transporter ATP-binding protein [Trichormus variabilis FSR]MBC1301245.1 ABC transporter ATP-binding protein [Trichormus variabilis N2B]